MNLQKTKTGISWYHWIPVLGCLPFMVHSFRFYNDRTVIWLIYQTFLMGSIAAYIAGFLSHTAMRFNHLQ